MRVYDGRPMPKQEPFVGTGDAGSTRLARPRCRLRTQHDSVTSMTGGIRVLILKEAAPIVDIASKTTNCVLGCALAVAGRAGHGDNEVAATGFRHCCRAHTRNAGTRADHVHVFAISSAAFSPIIRIATIGLTVGMVGKMEASAMRRPSSPRTRNAGSTTAEASSGAPILQVPAGW